MRKLPTGIQSFDEIRQEGYIYVDKTKYLVDMIDTGKFYFLSRPRRFGKSLTISTFYALFSGKRELFEGLYAEEYLNRPKYRPCPVIHLSMNGVVTNMGLDVLCSSLMTMIQKNAKRLGVNVDIGYNAPSVAFLELMEKVAEIHGKRVVVLIDEYDSPMLKFIDSPEKANEIRDIMKDFYVQIKEADASLRFAFITGISKFSKMGLFSALNNLTDISMNDEYATMLGYTEEEFMYSFSEYIDSTAKKLEIKRETLVSDIRDYYDGFSFDGKTRVYNPFSTLSFFKDPVFRNYWFESGTPSALAEYVKKHDLSVDTFRGIKVADDFTSETEIENATPTSFLYQAGYLSIRKKQYYEKAEGKWNCNLILDYPNVEVLSAIARLFMSQKLGLPDAKTQANDARAALSCGDAESFVEIYSAMLTGIPYDIYSREEKKYANKPQESFYHAMLLSMLWGAQIDAAPEKHSSRGRSDLEMSVNGRCYLVELKVADGEEKCKEAAEEAMKQILLKGYASPFAMSGVTLMAIAVDREERRVGAHEIRESVGRQIGENDRPGGRGSDGGAGGGFLSESVC